MSEKKTLDTIAASRAKLEEQLRQLDQEAADLRKEESAADFNQVIEILKKSASLFDTAQKNQIAGYVTSTAKAKKATGTKQPIAPKYWLPHTNPQETWTGRGRTPKAFAAWEGTAAYKEWKAKHPDEKFPKFPG